MTHDATHSYTYDAENRIVQVDGGSTAVYSYDALGRRVMSLLGAGTPGATYTFFIYGTDGNVITERDANNNWIQTYIRFGGRLLAFYRGVGTVYLHQDHLGSTRLYTGLTGNVYGTPLDYDPFGFSAASDNVDNRQFTGKERDSVSGLDYFGARYNSSSLGRFMSADPFNVAGDFVDSQNPQHWNMYSYVLNSPLNAVDPDGLDCVYVNDNSVSVKRGDCYSDSDKGIYINGTIDLKSGSYDQSTGTVSFNYTNDDTGAIGKGVIADVYPSGGVSDADRFNAVDQGMQIATPGVNLAANGLRTFGYIVAAPLMAVSECIAAGKDCNAAGTTLAVIPLPLTSGARKILGGILPLADETVANAIRIRGGGGAQVNQVASWLAQKTVGEVANLAAQGNAEARTAIKIIKDAARLAQK